MKLFRRAPSRCAFVVLPTATAAALLLLSATPATSATNPAWGAKVAVPQGIGAAALKKATVFGTTPGKTPETVSFVLKARNLNQLERSVQAGMPGGYLSVGQFASEFGQPEANIALLETYLSQYGITTSAYADGLDVTATGTASEFDRALSVQQDQYLVPAVRAADGRPGRPSQTVHGTLDSVLLPANVAQFVLSIVGLSNYTTFASTAVQKPALAANAQPSTVQSGSLTPANFAQQYNLSPLYADGATGAGRTIGIVTLASVDPADPEYFWNNVLNITTKPDRISFVNVDGGAGPVSLNFGSQETTLDVEQSGALAPQAKVVVYEAPNTDGGFMDAFFAAASQNVADSVSASWGQSESEIQASVSSGVASPTYATSFDEAFLEMAAQGQSGFLASGDFGAYDAVGDLGTTNLSTGNPGSSPWITTVGGTTLPGTIPLSSTVSADVSSQRTWGWDWLWPYYSTFGAPSESAFVQATSNGSGGGFSTLEPMPEYQQSVDANRFTAVPYLTPTAYQAVDNLNLPTGWNFNPTPAVTTGYGTGRAVPDLSANADPFTGYEVYDSQFAQAALQSGFGGTSFVAPQMSGSTAVIDSYVGHRVGFWNPAVYRFATQNHSPFTPLNSSSDNNNLYYTGTPGRIYNVGSGLGSPDLAALARDFADR